MFAPKRSTNRKTHRRLKLRHELNNRLESELTTLRNAAPSPAGMAETLQAVRALPASPHLPRRRRSAFRRWLPAICLGTALSVFTLYTSYWNTLNHEVIGEAAPAFLPANNSFGIYQSLASNVRLTTTDVMEALERLGKIGTFKDHVRISNNSTPWKREELLMRANVLLEHNKTVRAAIPKYFRVGFSEPEASNRSEGSAIANFQKLSDLLLLEARTAQEQRDYKKAAFAALDALHFAMKMQQNCYLASKLRAQKWEQPAREILWDILPSLDAETLKEARWRMGEIRGASGGIAQSLQRERHTGQDFLLQLFQQTPNWRMGDFRNTYILLAPDASAQWENRRGVRDFLSSLRWSNQTIYDNYSRRMNLLIEMCEKPFQERESINQLRGTGDEISEWMIPYVGVTVLRDAVSQTENLLLLHSITLYHYRRTHGEFPATFPHQYWKPPHSLESYDFFDPFTVSRSPNQPINMSWRQKGTEWVPECLSPQGLDINSFSLHYRRTGKDSFLLYSKGLDGKDNGGVPIGGNTPQRADGRERLIRVGLSGDIVAGVNRAWQ